MVFRKLTDFDFLGVQLADFVLQHVQPSLDPAGPPEDQSCLHLDAQEDVAGMSRKVGELVNYAGQRVTGNLVQRRVQNRLLGSAFAGLLSRSPAIPPRQPTHAPRINSPLVKGHL